MTQIVPRLVSRLAPQLDSQMAAFVENSMSYYPADAVGASIDQQRRWYRAMYESLAAPRPPNVVIKDISTKEHFLHSGDFRHVPCV